MTEVTSAVQKAKQAHTADPIHLYRNHHPAEAFMNLKAPSPWKLFAELPTQRKVDVIAVAIFLPLLCLKLMLTFSPLVLFLIVLGPCLIWIQSTKVAWWHAEQLPQGYYLRPRSILNVPSIVAAAVGLAAAGALDWLGSNYAVLGAAFSLTCALIGLLFLGLLFSAIGVRCGWARVVDPTEADDSLKGQPVITLARPPKSLLRSNIIYTLCIVGLLFTVVGYYIQIRAIDGPSDTDTSEQMVPDPTSQGIDTPSDVQTPAQAAQAPQEQPTQPQQAPVQAQTMVSETAPEPTPAQIAQLQPQAQPGQSGGLSATTYGNEVAKFFPKDQGNPKFAALDALGKAIPSSMLNITDVDPQGYPTYGMECEGNGQCVNDGGAVIGGEADAAAMMFPVNPVDIGRFGIMCGQYICRDSRGSVIGRRPN